MKRRIERPHALVRFFQSFCFQKREGVGLGLALLVLLVGGTLAAVIFDISFSFVNTSLQQRVTYVDHATVIDLIQNVKGFIVETNSRDGVVMHPNGYDGTTTPITDLSVIRFTNVPHALLSSDGDLKTGVGTQYYTLNVYDTHYLPGQIEDPLRSSPEQMRELPPPIHVTLNTTASGSDMESESDATAPDVGAAAAGSGRGGFNWNQYGSYLIRIRLYHYNDRNQRILARTAEEAFIQVLP